MRVRQKAFAVKINAVAAVALIVKYIKKINSGIKE